MRDGNTTGRVCAEEFDRDGTTVISVQEEYLTDAVADGLKCAVKRICRDRMEQGRKRLVLDLSDVVMIDSSGLSMLIAVRASTEGARLVLAGLSPKIEELLLMTNLDRVFDIYPDAESAIASFE